VLGIESGTAAEMLLQSGIYEPLERITRLGTARSSREAAKIRSCDLGLCLKTLTMRRLGGNIGLCQHIQFLSSIDPEKKHDYFHPDDY
jgi:hypothetical protein